MLRTAAGILIANLALSTSALAQRAEESKTDEIGPWEIEATFKSDKFDHCAISRTVDEIVARFVRTSDGLSSCWNPQTGNWSAGNTTRFA